MERRFISIKDLCEYTGWGESKVRKVAKNHADKFVVRYGNRIYIDKERFDDYINQCIKYQIPVS